MAKLTFNEAMILGAIGGGKIDPYQPGTWNNNVDFYRGLARIAKIMMEMDEIKLLSSQEQFEFWENEKDINCFKGKVKEVINNLKEEGLLSWIQ